MSTVNALTFSALRLANERRQAEWPGNDQIDKAFRTLETAGEGGELAEAIEVHLRTSLKALAAIGSLGRVSEQMNKFLRAERSIEGSTADVVDIGREMGDRIVSLDLLALELGIDLGDSTAAKFNETSEKYGLSTKLDPHTDSVMDYLLALEIAKGLGGPEDPYERQIFTLGIFESVRKAKLKLSYVKLSSAIRDEAETPLEGSTS